MAYEQTLYPAESVPPSPPPSGRAPWGYVDIALAIALVVGVTFAVAAPVIAIIAAVADLDLNRLDETDTGIGLLLGANGLLELLLFGTAALFTVVKYKVPWADLGLALPKKGSWWLPIVLLASAYLVVSVYVVAIYAVGAEPQEQVPDRAFDSAPLLVLVGVLSLALAPLMEETFFRGFIFGGLRGRLGLPIAALLSGFLFAIAHYDPLLFVPFTIVGVIFAAGYTYSGSLVAPIIAHFIFNSFALAFSVSGATIP